MSVATILILSSVVSFFVNVVFKPDVPKIKAPEERVINIEVTKNER